MKKSLKRRVAVDFCMSGATHWLALRPFAAAASLRGSTALCAKSPLQEHRRLIALRTPA